MSLLVLQSLIAVVNIGMMPFETTHYNVTYTPINSNRARSVSTASTDTTPSKQCDSGYNSDTEQQGQGKRVPTATTSRRRDNKPLDPQDKLQLQPQDKLARPPKKDQNRVTIRHEHMLYGILVLFVLGCIDKNLLVPSIMALVVAAVMVSFFVADLELERVLDLSAFHVQWKREVEVSDREVVTEVEKPVHHYLIKTEVVEKPMNYYLVTEVEVQKNVYHHSTVVEKPITKIKTIFVDKPTPAYADAEVQVDTTEELAKGTPMVTAKKMSPAAQDEQAKKKRRGHRGGKKARKQKAATSTAGQTSKITTTSVDQESSSATLGEQHDILQTATPASIEDTSTTTSTRGNTDTEATASRSSSKAAEFQCTSVRTTAGQEHGMRDAQTARNRMRKPGTKPSYVVEPIKDETEHDIDRSHIPFETLEDRRKTKEQGFHQKRSIYPSMPPARPGSAATRPGFDPYEYVYATCFNDRGEEVYNPMAWKETKTPNIFVSTSLEGTWLFSTADSVPYTFIWNQEHQTWFCNEYGIGVYENNPEDKCEQPFHFFHADLSVPCGDPATYGPARMKEGGKNPGPYWVETVKECVAATMKHFEENRKLYEEEQKKRLEEEQIRARASKEQQRRREEGARKMAAEAKRIKKMQDAQRAPKIPTQGHCASEQHRVSQQFQERVQQLQREEAAKQGKEDSTQYRTTEQPQQRASQQPPQGAHPHMTLQQAAEEHKRRVAEELETWKTSAPGEKKKAVFGEKMF
jgi:hypothetical protein